MALLAGRAHDADDKRRATAIQAANAGTVLAAVGTRALRQSLGLDS